MLETSTFARRAGSRAGRLPLVGGAAALDFANTASGRGGGHALEHLQVPGDLAAWAAHAALLDGRGLAALEDLPAPAAASLLVQALGLREAVHRAVSAVAAGRPAGEADLAVLAEAHRRGLAAAGLRPSSVGYRWQWDARSDPAEALLGRLAHSAVELLLQAEPRRLKRCGGRDCGWLFLDLTKNGRRRWCEMSVCGNRAKQRAWRERRLGA